MLLLMATTPVTLCECERSFNRLRIIKTYLPSIMSEDQLNRHSLYIYTDRLWLYYFQIWNTYFKNNAID